MSDDCLVNLEKWIISKKNKIYDDHVKSENDENQLHDYSVSLEDFAENIIKAIEDENTSKLRDLEWPEDLMECIKDVGIRVDIINHIDSWFIRYPFNRSKIHIKELQRENAGLQ